MSIPTPIKGRRNNHQCSEGSTGCPSATRKELARSLSIRYAAIAPLADQERVVPLRAAYPAMMAKKDMRTGNVQAGRCCEMCQLGIGNSNSAKNTFTINNAPPMVNSFNADNVVVCWATCSKLRYRHTAKPPKMRMTWGGLQTLTSKPNILCQSSSNGALLS